jgi:thioredoxin reductase
LSDSPEVFDAVIVGGGAAGLSAALSLGRARRRVLVACAGPTRNAPADAAHNIFTRDGTSPAELVRIGREQLSTYDVTIRDAWVTDASRTAEGFDIRFASGEGVAARAVILAMGVRDVLPVVAGLSERWGHGVFHCPYCHGWEVAGRPLGIYARGVPTDRVMHMVKLLRAWSDEVTLFTDGTCTLPDDIRSSIERNGVRVREEHIVELSGPGREVAGVSLESGETVECGGLMIAPTQELHSDLPARLGCAITADGRVQAQPDGRTTVSGVYVAGDLGPGMQSVASAIATGSVAGAVLNFAFAEQDFR